tara:strand:+ start:6062 stop:6583 length:522 start_codon:yes stop_codon:yes gene_type:complete
VNVSQASDIGPKINTDAASETNFLAVKPNTIYENLDGKIDVKKFLEHKKGSLGWLDDLFEQDEITKVYKNIGSGKKFDFTTNTGKANGLDWGVVGLDDCYLRYPNLVYDSTNEEYVAVGDFKEAFLYHWENQSMIRFAINTDLSLDTTVYEEEVIDYIQKRYNDLGGTGIRTV